MNIETTLRRVIIAGIFVIPFIAFLTFGNLYFPFISSKNFTFRILIEILLALWVLLVFLDSAYRPKLSWILISFSTFLGVIFLADIFGANFSRSFWSNFERMEGFIGLLHIFGYFLIATSVLSTEKLWKWYFQSWIFSSVIMALYGFLQLSGKITINQGGVRLDGTFGNSAYMAVYMLFMFFVTALLLSQEKKPFLRYIYGAAMLLQVVILGYTETRGAMLGLIAGILTTLFLIAVFERKQKMVRKIATISLAGVLLSVVVFMFVKDTQFVRESRVFGRLASISLTETTTKSRFMVWGMALKGFKENPILGTGQENFNLHFNTYYNPGMYAQEQWFDRAHNVFFDWLTAGGILGLLAYLSLFFSAKWYLWGRKRGPGMETFSENVKGWFTGAGEGYQSLTIIEKSILLGLIAGYFVQNLFVFDNLFSYILFFTILGYIHFLVVSDQDSWWEKRVERAKDFIPHFINKMAFQYVAVMVLLVFASVMYFVNIRPILANTSIINGLKPHAEGVAKNLESFKKAFALNTFGNPEGREQVIQMAVRVKDTQAPENIKTEFFDLARREILLQLDETPSDARYESFAAMLFARYGMLDEAIDHFEKGLALSGGVKQSMLFDLTSLYLQKRDTDTAFERAKKAYEIAPEFAEAQKVYALTAIYKEDNETLENLLELHFDGILPEEENFINALAAVGKYDDVVRILLARVEKSPEDFNLRLRLAAGYLEQDENAKAIEQIEKAVELNPEIKDQGEQFIEQIKSGKRPGT